MGIECILDIREINKVLGYHGDLAEGRVRGFVNTQAKEASNPHRERSPANMLEESLAINKTLKLREKEMVERQHHALCQRSRKN